MLSSQQLESSVRTRSLIFANGVRQESSSDEESGEAPPLP